MALHSLTSVTIGVPNTDETAAYYADFGLDPLLDGWFATRDGGAQLRIVPAPTRRLLDLCVGADDIDDLRRIEAALRRMDIASAWVDGGLTAVEPATGVRVTVRTAPRLSQAPVAPVASNGPGRYDRVGARAPGVLRTNPVRPRKLGHAVLGTTDFAATTSFFTDGLGFLPSDYIRDEGAFLRCSTDHHNVLVLRAPVVFLHHTSWQVDDIDEVGRGASAMLEADPDRHVWGLGRHHAGSNFFWYLKDPAGNFSEYYADMDCVVEDQLWTPETFQGAQGLFNWGPPPPASFLRPEDLAALMTGSHSS
ncbi:dioxygenase [Streptomyces sp. SID8361]|uniref:VOC family protein n=1 Tax=Streptomyces sp. MnatMP-M27 TaxID=1839768 RepID=UPI00081EC8F7|nr:VOC family protein [Streptomyces sp. MnatMP-M27]MYU09339.1 dioxygenase [Streptomyces sp. SID8361]SCF60933.1 Glyoxalase/Bleomycin resistance protein/Dioxygenase superfamily protein [Streptomyces sp. MnatMP-M27]